jgi:CBS domain-containing protein
MTGPTVVADLMSSIVTMLTAGAGLKEAAALMRSTGLSALPVVDGEGRVAGVLSEADLLVKVERPAPAESSRSFSEYRRRARWRGTLVGDLMSRPAVIARPDTTAPAAARTMLDYGLERLPVVDGAGRLVGSVGRRDLLAVFLGR